MASKRQPSFATEVVRELKKARRVFYKDCDFVTGYDAANREAIRIVRRVDRRRAAADKRKREQLAPEETNADS